MRAGKKERGRGEGIFARPLVLGDKLNFSVGVLFKIGSNFVQKVPPFYDFGFLRRYCLALASLGLGICYDFEGIFEIQKQFLPAQKKVRRAKHGQNKFLQTSLFSQKAKGKAII
jgi:hypothetical protein